MMSANQLKKQRRYSKNKLRELLSVCENNDVNAMTVLLNNMDSSGHILLLEHCMELFDVCILHDNVQILKLLLLFMSKQNKCGIEHVVDNIIIIDYKVLFKRIERPMSKHCFEYCVSIFTDINSMRLHGFSFMTPLRYACLTNNNMAVGILLKYGADVNNTHFGENVLHAAIDNYSFVNEKLSFDVIRMLLLAGVDVHAKNKYNLKPGEIGFDSRDYFGLRNIGDAARSFAENCY